MFSKKSLLCLEKEKMKKNNNKSNNIKFLKKWLKKRL